MTTALTEELVEAEGRYAEHARAQTLVEEAHAHVDPLENMTAGEAHGRT